jgi:proline dehydrogenase
VNLERWVCTDLTSAIIESRTRNEAGLRVILDPLTDYVKNDLELDRSIDTHVQCIKEISSANLRASITIKLSALGMSFNRDACRSALNTVAEEAIARSVNVEMDMEGRGSIDFTILCAKMLTDRGIIPTIAVQAYMNRSIADTIYLQRSGIGIRLVKGAYQGDQDGFEIIQSKMMTIIDKLTRTGGRFSVGSHDPILIDYLTRDESLKPRVELGFLKGIGSETKNVLASKGWCVVEYIPFGADYKAYVRRREIYLGMLSSTGKSTIP